jgi:hypothetical protein
VRLAPIGAELLRPRVASRYCAAMSIGFHDRHEWIDYLKAS